MDFSLILEYVRMFLEISLMAFVIYGVLLFLRGTRGAPILAGIVIIWLGLTLFAAVFDLEVISWIMSKLIGGIALLLVIIFQPEIRRAFAELGTRRSGMTRDQQRAKENINAIVAATFYLAQRKIGALISLERGIGMRNLAETGVNIGAELSQELLCTFFYPNTPLHDGGVIIRGSEILSAGCFFPLTQNMDLSKALGTRHRAGVGVTEETDCVCIIVSEESGTVSLAYKGRLARGLTEERLSRHLNNLIIKNASGTKVGNVDMLKQLFSDEESDVG